MDCGRCEHPRQAIAILPMPAGSPIKPIAVCSIHAEEARLKCWFLTTLDGIPIGEDSLNRMINEKHRQLRGTDELLYKPRHLLGA